MSIPSLSLAFEFLPALIEAKQHLIESISEVKTHSKQEQEELIYNNVIPMKNSLTEHAKSCKALLLSVRFPQNKQDETIDEEVQLLEELISAIEESVNDLIFSFNLCPPE